MFMIDADAMLIVARERSKQFISLFANIIIFESYTV